MLRLLQCTHLSFGLCFSADCSQWLRSTARSARPTGPVPAGRAPARVAKRPRRHPPRHAQVAAGRAAHRRRRAPAHRRPAGHHSRSGAAPSTSPACLQRNTVSTGVTGHRSPVGSEWRGEELECRGLFKEASLASSGTRGAVALYGFLCGQ